MGKSEKTLRLEESIYQATKKQGTFGCFEVTIGWFGNERVDYLTYSTDGTWRCYEVKATVSDFRSKAAKTFVGHLNYFVMPQELYDKVKGEIPDGIGVYIDGTSTVRAKRRELGVDEKILWQSMIRSLAREYQNTRRSEKRSYVAALIRELNAERRNTRNERRANIELEHAITEKYGRKFWHDLFADSGLDCAGGEKHT